MLPRLPSFILVAAIAAPAVSARADLSVSGTVQLERDRPLSGARVELLRASSAYEAGLAWLDGEERPRVASVETDANGRFRLPVPEAGAYEVAAGAAGRAPMTFGPLVVTRSRELPPVTLPKLHVSSVRVVDAIGRPVSGAWVAPRPVLTQPRTPEARLGWRLAPQAGRTDAAGTVMLSTSFGLQPEVEVLVPASATPISSVVTGGLVRLPPVPSAPVSLRLALASGEPAEGVLVRLTQGDWPLGLTDGSGELSLTIAAGSVTDAELITRDGIRHRIVLAERGAEAPAIPLPAAAPAVGRILDAVTGKGVAGALVAPSRDLGQVSVTDETGRFSLVVAPGGLEAHAPGYLPKRVSVREMEVLAGRVPAIGLEPSALVTGRVVTVDGSPLAGVAVEAVPESSLADRPFTPSELVVDRVISDVEGRFELAGLRPGTGYELRLRKEGHLPTLRSVVTAPARQRPPAVEVTLPPARVVVGRVEDPEGRPLAGVAMTLRPALRIERQALRRESEGPAKPGGPGAAVSDRNGWFRIARCPAAEFDLEARLEGYAPTRRERFRAGSGAAPLDVGTVVLHPGAVLAGKVLDAARRPVRGAEVFLLDHLPAAWTLERVLESMEPLTTTTADGTFRVADLPTGVARSLVITADGFLPASLRGVRPPTDRPLLVRMDEALELKGRVVDEAEHPVTGAELSLSWHATLEGDPYRRPVGREVLRTSSSGEDGHFVIRGAPGGRAELRVSAEGYLPLEPITIELPRPERSEPILLRLRRGAVLQGRVTTTGGEPVAGAVVLAAEASAASDAEGYYRVAGVPEGEQQVEVRHRSYRRVSRSAWIEEGDNRLDLELPAGVPVEGRVVESGGVAVPGARVRLHTEGERERREYTATSDADGYFHIVDVATGRYRVEASAFGYPTIELPGAVTVEHEPLHGLEITLDAGAMLSGSLLGLSLEALPAVRVEARSGQGETRSARLDAAGTYEVGPLAPGDWLVRATLWQGQKEATARVVVAPGDRELTRDLEFGQGLTLSGIVLFEEQPLPDAVLTLRGQSFALERTVLTSFDGRFRLEELEPDTYQVGISRSDQLIVHNQWLELTGDLDIEIRLGAATVSGVVRDGEGHGPVAGALIRLVPTTGPEFLIVDSSREDGSFHLPRVPPSPYLVEVTADGFSPFQQEISLAAGESVSGLDVPLQPTSGALIDLSLAAGGVPQLVHLLVLDVAGQPILAESRVPDPQGRVWLASLPPGTWQLLVSAPGAATAAGQVVVPGVPLSLTLQTAGRLHLRVPALATSDLLASVRVFGTDQQPLWLLVLGGQVETSWPMAGGLAAIDGIPAGSWLVQVESSDGRTWTGTIVTSGSGDTTMTLL